MVSRTTSLTTAFATSLLTLALLGSAAPAGAALSEDALVVPAVAEPAVQRAEQISLPGDPFGERAAFTGGVGAVVALGGFGLTLVALRRKSRHTV